MPVIPAFKRLGQENRGLKGRDWKPLGSNSTTRHTQFKASLAPQLRSRGVYASVVEHSKSKSCGVVVVVDTLYPGTKKAQATESLSSKPA